MRFTRKGSKAAYAYGAGRKQKRSLLKRAVSRLKHAIGRQFTYLSRSIALTLHAMTRAVWSVFGVFGHLQRSRNFRKLLAGLPALAVLFASLGFFIYQYFRADDIRSRLATRYARAGFGLIDRDAETAVVYFDRLIQLRSKEDEGEDSEPDQEGQRNHNIDKEAVFGLALALEKSEDLRRLQSVISTIAPMTHAVYAPAHTWRGSRILETQENSLTPELVRTAEIQLNYALELDPRDAKAHLYLGKLYFMLQRYHQAVEHLSLAVERYPEELLLFAKAHLAIGQRDEAAFYGAQAVSYFTQALQDKPLDIVVLLSLAEAQMFVGNFDESLRRIRQGLAVQESPQLRQAMARVHIAHAAVYEERGMLSEQLVEIQRAIEAYPDEVMALEQVLKLLQHEGQESEKLRGFLKSALTEGKATALIHLVLGIDAGGRGEYDAAIRHFDLALKAEPRMAIAANNLGWMLAHQDEPEYDRALELVNAALAQAPAEPSYLHTRGIILVKMERWQEAVLDLEKVLNTKGDADARNALATAYDKLGLGELAAEQRAAAERQALEQKKP